MKVHWSLWVALAVLILTIVILSARREGYAPPRDENTNPPYTEDVGNTVTTSNNLPYIDSTSDVVQVDNQTDIYKDMGGMDFQIQAGNPILNFIQGDPSSNVMYGDFVPNESDGGSARMYAYGVESESTEENMLPPVPTVTSNLVPVVGVDIKGSPIMPVPGVDIESRTDIPDSGQYMPELTSPSIPFLGEQPGISASESPASVTSPATTQ
jgi:hypothetical protein